MGCRGWREERAAAAASAKATPTMTLTAMSSGGGPSFQQRGRGHIRAPTTAAIMVRAMKSICEPSLPLRVYGPMRSTHKASQGILKTVFAGRCPYLRFRFLFVWQVLQDFVIDWMVVRIPFQYIAALIVSSRRVCLGCWR